MQADSSPSNVPMKSPMGEYMSTYELDGKAPYKTLQ